MDMTVFILTGMPGSGKEEFVQTALSEGYDVVRMGDVVRRECEKRGLEMGDGSIGGFASNERQVHGDDIWARRTASYMTGERIVVDGCRSLPEIEAFRRTHGNNVRVVAVHSRPETRFERLVSRGRSDAPEDWEEFEVRDDRELGWGIGGVISKAGTMLVNEGTLESFHEAVRGILRSEYE